MSRDGLSALGINLGVNIINHDCLQTLEQILESHGSVFKSSAGCLLGTKPKVKLYTEPGTILKFCRAQQPLYALREAIEEELSGLQSDGIIEPIQHSKWATLIIPMRKDRTIRICGDYETTLNKVCEGDNHPILYINDLAFDLSGGDKYIKLDLT
ncbi:Pol polyprotein [Elysia marginata]|uniref:Pol polyprotein n=1 Tax=Elysia marginata TaxID=1093978 RepID=A0AAV4F1K9_9GAST|nr:Pol polyprotein [Elysia marginata]